MFFEDKIVKIIRVGETIQAEYDALVAAEKEAGKARQEAQQRIWDFLKKSTPEGVEFLWTNEIVDGCYISRQDRFSGPSNLARSAAGATE